MSGIVQEFIEIGDVEKRNTLEEGAPGDDEEMLPVGLGETAVAFRDIGGNGCSRAIKLIGKEIESAWTGLGECNNRVGKFYGVLINTQLLEQESHGRFDNRKKRLENRPQSNSSLSVYRLLDFLLFDCSIKDDI